MKILVSYEKDKEDLYYASRGKYIAEIISDKHYFDEDVVNIGFALATKIPVGDIVQASFAVDSYTDNYISLKRSFPLKSYPCFSSASLLTTPNKDYPCLYDTDIFKIASKSKNRVDSIKVVSGNEKEVGLPDVGVWEKIVTILEHTYEDKQNDL